MDLSRYQQIGICVHPVVQARLIRLLKASMALRAISLALPHHWSITKAENVILGYLAFLIESSLDPSIPIRVRHIKGWLGPLQPRSSILSLRT
jgi:hypothetical protein